MHTAFPASHLGTLIKSRYRLQRVLGEGASSWVFAAHDTHLERDVALKLFKSPNSEDQLKRHRRCVAEGRTLAKLVHPHIVSVIDASLDGTGQIYLVMELCEAGTLEAELLRRGRLELPETLALVLPLLGALAFSHDRKVVHRDIKPANIVLLQSDGGQRCKLLDFGISLSTGVGMSSDLALGTPSYMAPEQARGEPPCAATDVWAIGVVLFRCLTGELPFVANSSSGVLLKVAQERAPRFASLCPQLGPHLALALDRALEPDLGRRYRDMRSFACSLAAACSLDGVLVAPRPEPIGLPDFPVWLEAGASAQTTQNLVLPKREPSPPSPPLVRRTGIAALIVLLTGLAIGGLRSASEAGHERSQVHTSPAQVAVSQPPSPSAEHEHALVGEPQGRVAADALGQLSGAAPLPAQAEPPRPAAAAKAPPRKQSSPRVVKSEPSSKGPRRIIPNWDW